jgi:hypothetical protein
MFFQPAALFGGSFSVWNVVGQLPADTLFFLAQRGDFDVVIAMYHDQGPRSHQGPRPRTRRQHHPRPPRHPHLGRPLHRLRHRWNRQGRRSQPRRSEAEKVRACVLLHDFRARSENTCDAARKGFRIQQEVAFAHVELRIGDPRCRLRDFSRHHHRHRYPQINFNTLVAKRTSLRHYSYGGI